MEPERQELITAAAIARLAGVGRAAVSNWRKRYPGFPAPTGGSPNSPTFDRAEVLTWLKETGKADQLATAGRTDGGTIRAGASGTSALETSFETMFAETWKRLPERSISDLLPGDLLARAMVAPPVAPRRLTRNSSHLSCCLRPRKPGTPPWMSPSNTACEMRKRVFWRRRGQLAC